MKKLISTIVLCAIIMVALTIPVSASTQKMELPDSFLIADSFGINVERNGDYYIEAKDLLPGDKISKKLIIQSLSDDSKKYRLYLSATPMEQTGMIKLLEELEIDMKLDGETIYSGSIDGLNGGGMVDNALDLGIYEGGRQGVLTFDIQLDPTLSTNLFYEKSVAELGWKFYAVRDEEASPPKTGKTEQTVTYLVIGTAVLIASILLAIVIKRKKYKKNEAPLAQSV